jgi:hypothetical protein
MRHRLCRLASVLTLAVGLLTLLIYAPTPGASSTTLPADASTDGAVEDSALLVLALAGGTSSHAAALRHPRAGQVLPSVYLVAGLTLLVVAATRRPSPAVSAVVRLPLRC